MNGNEKIQGWMHPKDLHWLYETAKTMQSIVEIGCWKGRSTSALLQGCPGRVYAVDHFLGNPEERHSNHKEALEKNIGAEFLRNVGHHRNLRLMRMDSLEAATFFKDRSIDMVFIDGSHEYEAVKADLEAWLPKARKLICGHDPTYPGVKKATAEKFGEVEIQEGIWIHWIEGEQ